ncbi:hypothetical protein CJP74_05960 [Psittacicella melopsittaci]|uniref:EamA domain-containing protein n=1 Tax=Psittacicella melopsittaci TaxID=2028576 RepID=A0A3A1Y381_9GAMM|nr:hypothetical protein CJP74_05960 [Psittacicella melopsittaci]
MSWIVYALLAAIFAACTAIFAKVGLVGINSDLATFIRTCFIVAITAAWVSYLGKWESLSGVSIKQWIFLFLSAASTGLSWLFYFKALQEGTAAHVASLDKLSVVFVAVFAFIFLGEKLSWREIFGLGLMITGILILTLKPSVAQPQEQQAQTQASEQQAQTQASEQQAQTQASEPQVQTQASEQKQDK